jgi:HK97 family phage major capsid protein
MRSRRAELVTQMRAILDTARGEDRDLTAEDKQSYTKAEADFKSLDEKVELEESQAAREGRLAHKAVIVNPATAADDDADESFWALFQTPEYNAAFTEYMRRTANGMSPDSRSVLDRVQMQAAAFNVATDGQGGYTVPENWRNQLVEARTQYGVLRQLATIIQTAGGEPLHIPKVTDAQVATLTAEAAGYTESEDTFDEAILNAYKYGVIVKISEELLNDSLFDMAPFISRRAGRAIALKEGAAFATGDGSSKPNGITVAATVGITSASATALTSDELLDFVHSVAPPYRPGAQWVMHDSTLLAIAKLVDDFNNYVWQPGLKAGDPDMIRGYPVYIDPFYDTIAAAKVVATFGDHSGYYIRECGPVVSQRLVELYAANGQVGFRFAERVDGDLVDTAAVKSLKTHA